MHQFFFRAAALACVTACFSSCVLKNKLSKATTESISPNSPNPLDVNDLFVMFPLGTNSDFYISDPTLSALSRLNMGVNQFDFRAGSLGSPWELVYTPLVSQDGRLGAGLLEREHFFQVLCQMHQRMDAVAGTEIAERIFQCRRLKEEVIVDAAPLNPPFEFDNKSVALDTDSAAAVENDIDWKVLAVRFKLCGAETEKILSSPALKHSLQHQEPIPPLIRKHCKPKLRVVAQPLTKSSQNAAGVSAFSRDNAMHLIYTIKTGPLNWC